MKKYYLMEKIAAYDWVDVYEGDDLRLMRKFLITLKTKYPQKVYMICEVK